MKSLLVCTLVWTGLVASTPAALIGTYTFATPTSVPTAANTTFGVFSRVGPTAEAPSGMFGSSAFSQSGLNTAQYVQFTVAPASGYQVTLSSLAFTYASEAANNGGQHGGPDNLQMRIFDSSDLGSALATSSTLTGARALTSFAYDPADLSSANGFTIRIYGWSTSGNSDGFLNLDNVEVNGGLTPVPEPTNVALALFGLLAVGCTAGRRWQQARRSARQS